FIRHGLRISALAAHPPAVQPAGINRPARRRLAARRAWRLDGDAPVALLPPAAPPEFGVQRAPVHAERAREVGERLVPRVPDGIVRYVACVHGQNGRSSESSSNGLEGAFAGAPCRSPPSMTSSWTTMSVQ